MRPLLSDNEAPLRELRPGDRVYCMPCMSRMIVAEREDGRLEAEVVF